MKKETETGKVEANKMDLTFSEAMEFESIKIRLEGLNLIQNSLIPMANEIAKAKIAFFFKLFEARGLSKDTQCTIENHEIKIKDAERT